MKTLISVVSLGLLAMSLPTFAADNASTTTTTTSTSKVTITGEPVVLQQEGDVYALPKGYTTTNSYYYVTVDGTKRVCYLEKQPTLTVLDKDLTLIDVQVDGKKVKWNCYPFDETYFEVTP